jgi:hypothetical protein
MKRRFCMVFLGAALVATVCADSARPIALAQQPKCLHGPDETPAERELRGQALTSARSINTGESRTASERERKYRPIGQLGGVVMPPYGFDVTLVTDGSAYAFSIKDMRDPCLFTLFSDQNGVIFVGEALR